MGNFNLVMTDRVELGCGIILLPHLGDLGSTCVAYPYLLTS